MHRSTVAQAGAIVGGDFRILGPLGKGGMGEVYLAEQLSTAKRRAVKLMKPELLGDASLVARFEQEARVGARIESEHVVEVVAAGIDIATGAPYLAMELLEGESLDRVLLRVGAMPPGDVREVLAQLGHGLAAAHRAGVVHRDLKPENVFIATAKQQGQRFKVKILDFGIAKLTAEAANRTRMTMSLGTPRWMAPEQTGGAQLISAATDVWALGLLTYWMLTGRYYWKHAAGGPSDSVMTLMREVLFEPLVPASVRAREQGATHLLPPGFDAWFARAVAREPSERHADAAQAVAALDPVLAATSRTAGSQSFVTGGRAWTAAPSDVYGETVARSMRRPAPPRSPWLKLAIGALALGALAGSVFGVWALQERQAAQAERERAEEKERRREAEARKKRRASSPDDDDEPPPKPTPPSVGPLRPISGAELTGLWKVTLGENPGRRGRYSGAAEFEPYGDGYRLTWSFGHEGLAIANGPAIGAVYVASGTKLIGTVLLCRIAGGVIDCRASSTERHGIASTHTFQGPGGLNGSYTLVRSSDGRSGKLVLQRRGDGVAASFELSGWPVEHGSGVVRGDRLAIGVARLPAVPSVVLYELGAEELSGIWLQPNGSELGREVLRRP